MGEQSLPTYVLEPGNISEQVKEHMVSRPDAIVIFQLLPENISHEAGSTTNILGVPVRVEEINGKIESDETGNRLQLEGTLQVVGKGIDFSAEIGNSDKGTIEVFHYTPRFKKISAHGIMADTISKHTDPVARIAMSAKFGGLANVKQLRIGESAVEARIAGRRAG